MIYTIYSTKWCFRITLCPWFNGKAIRKKFTVLVKKCSALVSSRREIARKNNERNRFDGHRRGQTTRSIKKKKTLLISRTCAAGSIHTHT